MQTITWKLGAELCRMWSCQPPKTSCWVQFYQATTTIISAITLPVHVTNMSKARPGDANRLNNLESTGYHLALTMESVRLKHHSIFSFVSAMCSPHKAHANTVHGTFMLQSSQAAKTYCIMILLSHLSLFVPSLSVVFIRKEDGRRRLQELEISQAKSFIATV